MGPNDQPDRLLAIIDAQNEIMATELELDAVVRLVASRARSLTGAETVVIELSDGEDEPCAPDGDGPVLCVPVHDGDVVLGALKAHYPAGSFAPEDERTLELLAGLVAARLVRAQRFGDDAESRRDQLTELPNRRAYEERLAREAERARRYRRPLALVVLDLDGFGAVNDALGHPAGDEILAGVAALLAGSRFADEVFRIGADEFAILMPQTELDGAKIAARRIAAQIAAGGFGDGITVSWGAACEEGHPGALHERAVKALLAAKSARADLASAG